jgi:hypothetical protein
LIYIKHQALFHSTFQDLLITALANLRGTGSNLFMPKPDFDRRDKRWWKRMGDHTTFKLLAQPITKNKRVQP